MTIEKTTASYPARSNITRSVSKSAKTPVKKQSDKTPTARKLGFTFAGILAGLSTLVIAPKIFRKPNLQECQKQFSEIFRREVSASETEALIKKYKELYKIDNAREFTKKAIERVKKDYGYENTQINCNARYCSFGNIFRQMAQNKLFMYGQSNQMNLNMNITVLGKKPEQKLKRSHKDFILRTLFHEFKHMQQFEYCYHKDKNQYYKSIWNQVKANVQPQIIESDIKFLEHKIQKQQIPASKKILFNENFLNKIFHKKNKPQKELTLEERFYKLLDYTYTRNFGNCPKKDLSKYDSVINKYFKSFNTYKTAENVKNINEYKNQFVETEAYSAGDFAERIANIWYNPLEFFKGKIPIGLAAASGICFAKDGYDNFIKKDSM